MEYTPVALVLGRYRQEDEEELVILSCSSEFKETRDT